MGGEGIWGDFTLSCLVKVVVGIFGEGVVGEVADGLKGLGFDFSEVGWGTGGAQRRSKRIRA